MVQNKIIVSKALVIGMLLIGCAREYRCDAGPPCELDASEITEGVSTISLGTDCDIRITIDWPDGEKDAEEACDKMYNDDPSTGLNCTCKKDN